MSSDVFIKYVLDRSGSMEGIWDQTLSSFNEYKNDQARQDGTAYMTLTVFDSSARGNKPNIDTIVEAKDAKEIEDLTRSVVAPRGMTPLYDAIGVSIEEVEDWLVSKENADFDGKVLFVINTDGYENSSTEFTLEGLQKKIDEKKAKGWEFVFMGAGLDASKEAAQFNIHNAVAYAADNVGTRGVSRSLSATTTAYRNNDKFEWKEDLD
jgi:hypothetical protein